MDLYSENCQLTPWFLGLSEINSELASLEYADIYVTLKFIDYVIKY